MSYGTMSVKMNIHVYTTIPIEHTSGRFCVLLVKLKHIKQINPKWVSKTSHVIVIVKHQVAMIKQGTL